MSGEIYSMATNMMDYFDRSEKEKQELRAEIQRLKSDRSAFAEETQTYREAWLGDQKEISRLRELLAVAEGALERFDLADEVMSGYDGCKDETNYCGWHIGNYRKVKSALAAIRDAGKEGEK